jgi:uncharacterized protein
MSSAPSSIPEPSFGIAPERPDGVERPERPAPPDRPRWKPWTAWVALIGGIAGALMGALFIGVIAVIAGAGAGADTPAVSISATFVQDGCLVASALLFAGLAGRPLPQQFGLRPTRLLPAIGWMAAAFVSFYVVTAAWVAIAGANPDDDQLTKQLGVDRSTVAMLAVALLVSVVAPVCEEFFFRGYFYGALRNWRGMWPAAIITGLVFGAIHAGSADIAFLLPLGFFGFVLCLLRERTGSLYPCMALHCANNSLAFGVSQHWSWQIPVLFVVSLSIITAVALVVRGAWAPAPAPA